MANNKTTPFFKAMGTIFEKALILRLQCLLTFRKFLTLTLLYRFIIYLNFAQKVIYELPGLFLVYLKKKTNISQQCNAAFSNESILMRS